MATATRTPSQRGRASRAKGARFERAIAGALKPWLPDVRRSRDNGSTTTADTGDLADAGPGIWWSLKDVAASLSDPPWLVDGWLKEARDKSAGRLPIVVQKRQGFGDPLMSWAWLWLPDLSCLLGSGSAPDAPVRLALRDALSLLAEAGYVQRPPTVVDDHLHACNDLREITGGTPTEATP